MEENNSITLKEIGRVLFKNTLSISIIVLVTTIIGAVYTFALTTPKYSSTASIIVQVPVGSSNSQYDIVSSLRYVDTVLDAITENTILKPVAEKNDISLNRLTGMVSVSNATNSSLIRISITCDDPLLSQKLANDVAAQVIAEAREGGVLFFAVNCISQSGEALAGRYTSPNKTLYLIVSVIIGFVLAVCVVFIKEFMSNKFKTKEEVEQILNNHVIGYFVDKKIKNNEDNSNLEELGIHELESYNRLLNNIKYYNVDMPSKAIMITSSIKDELKTTTTVNLSQCMILNSKKVIIIDLDLHKPTVHKYFKFERENGIVDYLTGDLEKENLIRHTDSGIDVITAGKSVNNPNSLLESIKLKDLIKELKEKYDYVIIDTPPTYSCSDSSIIANLADGIIYNVSMNYVHKNVARDGINSLKDKNVIGVNITNGEKNSNLKYYYY